jgi:alkylation response protein AidB-like acyl-CoA dehydrogenase
MTSAPKLSAMATTGSSVAGSTTPRAWITFKDLPTALEIPERQATVFFDQVRVGPDRLLGEEHRAG